MKKLFTLTVLVFAFLVSVTTTANAQRVSNGVYKICLASDPRFVIDLDNSQAECWRNIQLWEWNNTNAQKWYVEDNPGSHSVTIRSMVNRNFVLDLYHSELHNGNNIQLYQDDDTSAQEWKLEPVDGGYIIHSAVRPGHVIDVDHAHFRAGTNIQIWERNGSNAQVWKFVRVY